MGINLLYDTNIFIYHLNGSVEYQQYFQKDFLEQNQVYLSSITTHIPKVIDQKNTFL